MLKSSGVQLPPKKQQKTYVTGESMVSEWESEMVHYVKQESGLVSGYLKLVLCLMCVPLLTLLVFLASLMAVFGMWVMWLKDLGQELTQLCSALFSLGRRKHRGIPTK